MTKRSILIVDDEAESLASTQRILKCWGYDADGAASPSEALDIIRSQKKQYAATVLDYRMPEMNGAELAAKIRETNAETVLLIYSAYPSIDAITSSMRARAVNFIGKDEDIEALKSAIESAVVEHDRIRTVQFSINESESTRLIASLGMVGRSEKLARVAEKVIKYRESNKPVLILGETGSGKELIAKALHTGRADSFFPVNCANLENAGLADSELFGHEKGSFTGAAQRKVGIFEAARGGTVYLDELQHLSLSTQTKLLRVLRENKVRRVGAVQEEAVTFKLIASSWPDIEERVANKTFLPDLYYRIRFLTVSIPPLRERPEDIAPLVDLFCQRYFKETGLKRRFLDRTIRYFEEYAWPGNVGELDGIVNNLLADSSREIVDDGAIEELLPLERFCKMSLEEIEARKSRDIMRVVRYTLMNSKSKRQAALRLGIKPSTLHSMLDKLGLRGDIAD
jgi:DNA-binding NtrC family response regulator